MTVPAWAYTLYVVFRALATIAVLRYTQARLPRKLRRP